MQYVVTAYDEKGEGILERRLKVREQHLKIVEENFKAGKQVFGGAILDEAGKMIGSMMVFDYESREELDKWLEIEPFVTEKVWDKIEIQQFNVAPIFMGK